jgi:hypothetical protein
MDVRQDQLERRYGCWHWSYEELRLTGNPSQWPPVEAFIAKSILIEAIEKTLDSYLGP